LFKGTDLHVKLLQSALMKVIVHKITVRRMRNMILDILANCMQGLLNARHWLRSGKTNLSPLSALYLIAASSIEPLKLMIHKISMVTC